MARGQTHGPTTDGSRRDRPMQSAVVALLIGVMTLVVVVGVFLAVLGQGPDPVDPPPPPTQVTSSSPSPTSAPNPTQSAATPGAPSDAPGSDPPDLPQFPGATRTGYEEGIDGGVRWLRIDYVATATADEVRMHYREAMRVHGWFVGDVDFDDGAWRFDANRETRELTLAIVPDGATTRVTVYISDLVADPTRRPPAPATEAPAPATQAPDDDDDDDDDDGDDDGDD